MRLVGFLCLWVLLGAGGCRAGAPPVRPPPPTPIPASVTEARLAIRAGDGRTALERLESRRPMDAAEPERSWLLAHLWAGQGQTLRARRAARAMAPGPFRDALLATLAENVDDGFALVAARRRSGADWPHLAASMLHEAAGEPGRALGASALALRSPRVFVRVEAHLVRARVLLDEGRLPAAAAEAARAAALEPTDTRAWSLEAEVARRRGETVEALRLVGEAWARVPDSSRYPRMITDLLHRSEDGGPLDAPVALLLDRVAPPDSAGTLALRGLLDDRAGRAEAAIARYRAALGAGASPVPLERDLRRLLCRRGDHAEAVALLRRAVPPVALEAGGHNLRADRWRALFAAVAEAPDASARPEARERLASALVGVGALGEARSVLERLDTPSARGLLRRLEAEKAFEEALEELVEGGYRTVQGDDNATPLRALLARVPALASEHLPPDEAALLQQPTRGLRDAAFLGSWLDHSTDTTSPLVAYFRRYGRYLIFGERGGGPPEAILLSMASLTRAEPLVTRGGCYRHDVCIGYEAHIRSFIDAQGGALGGACLPDGLWLDASAARQVEHGLQQLLEASPAAWSDLVASPELVRPDVHGVLSLGEPSGVAARLTDRYLRRSGGAGWGSFGTLVAHEAGHVVELRRHLPIMRGLPRTMALLAKSSFSPDRVERELERRAQLAAVASAPDPDLALAELLVPLPVFAREPEVHDGGYADGALDMMRHVYARPDLYPQIDRRYRILPQLSRLTNDQIRQAARAVLPR